MGTLAERHCLSRTNAKLARIVLWSALATCVIGATVYDIGHWVTAW